MNTPAVVTSFAALVFTLGCTPEPKHDPASMTAQFGVFFGGQIQERREIPFELDRAKQTLGFRIDFAAPLAEDTRVEWLISAPATRRQKKPARSPAVEPTPDTPAKVAASDVAHAGERRFERTTPFDPGDPVGLWNARVVVGSRVALDRAFEVFDPVARARAMKPDAGY